MKFKISAFYFFYFGAIAVYVIFMPSLLKQNGFSTSEIGIIFSLAPLSRFLSPFFFIKHFRLNQNSFRLSLLMSQVCGVLVLLFMDSFWALFFIMIVFGFFWSIILPFIENLALEYIGKDNYGKSRLFGSIGFIFVSLILGNDYVGIKYSEFVYIFTITMTVLFGFLLYKYIKKSDVLKSRNFSFLTHLNFWIAIFLTQVSFGAFYNFFTIYEKEAGVALDTISYLWSFGVIAEILMFRYQSVVLKKFSLNSLISFGIIMASLRWLAYYLFPINLIVLFIASSLHAFSFAMLHTASIAYINEQYQNKQLAQQFYVGITFGLGGFAGSLISGKMYGSNIFLYASIIALVAFFVNRITYIYISQS